MELLILYLFFGISECIWTGILDCPLLTMLALAIVQGLVLDDDNGGRRLTTTYLGSQVKELVKRTRGGYNIYNTHSTKNCNCKCWTFPVQSSRMITCITEFCSTLTAPLTSTPSWRASHLKLLGFEIPLPSNAESMKLLSRSS